MTPGWRVDESKILSRGEVELVMQNLARKARRSVNTRQNRAVFVLATCCGLRVSELCGLKLRDLRLDIQRPVIQIPAAIAKGKKKREIPLWKLATALLHLQDWKNDRKAQGAKPTDRFVCSQAKNAFGKPLDRRNARARFLATCDVLGQERRDMLTIHDGRHTCASHLLAAGWPLPAVRDMLGHANISTTSIYSHIVVDDEVPPDPFAFAGNNQEVEEPVEETEQTPHQDDLLLIRLPNQRLSPGTVQRIERLRDIADSGWLVRLMRAVRKSSERSQEPVILSIIEGKRKCRSEKLCDIIFEWYRKEQELVATHRSDR